MGFIKIFLEVGMTTLVQSDCVISRNGDLEISFVFVLFIITRFNPINTLV